MNFRTNFRATQLLLVTATASAAAVIHMQNVHIEGLL